MLTTVIGTALNLLGELDFAEGTQKALKTNIYGASVRDKMDASMGYKPYATQTNKIERRLHTESEGGTFNHATDSTVVLQKGQTNYQAIAEGEQDKNKNDWLSGTLKTVGGLIGGIDLGGLIGGGDSSAPVDSMTSKPATTLTGSTVKDTGLPGGSTSQLGLNPSVPKMAPVEDIVPIEKMQALPTYTPETMQAPLLNQGVPYKQTSSATPLAANGVKTTTAPNMKVVSWRKIRDGNYATETVPVSMNDGTKALAKKGEIEVDLQDDSGKTSKAVLNRDQWRSYLAGNDINDILTQVPTTQEASVAAGGITDAETQYKAESIADLNKGKSDFMKALDEYYASTTKANAARNIVNMGGSLGGVIYNLTNKSKFTPLQPYSPSVAPVHLERPSFSEEQSAIDRAFLALLQTARESGNTGAAPALLGQYIAGVGQLGEKEANERFRVANTEAAINTQAAAEMEQIRGASVQRTNEYNKGLEMEEEKLRRDRDEKTAKMLQDMFNSPTTMAALNAKGKFDIASMKWAAEKDYNSQVNNLISNIE